MLKNKKRLKPLLLDIFAMNSFCYVVSFINEILIAKMSWDEHINARLIALVVNTLIARPYSLWRDFVYDKMQFNEQDNFIKSYFIESLLFLSFQLPIYIGTVALAGAEMDEIMIAAGTITLFAGLLGKPYSVYLDWLTNKAGLEFNTKEAREASS